MQRAMVVISVLLLVAVGSGLGALAAHWPFWQRAWSWQQSPHGWPLNLQGPWRYLRPAAQVAPLAVVSDMNLAALANGTETTVLLVAEGGSVRAHYEAGHTAQTLLDGHALTQGLLAPLYGVLMAEGRATLLDEPVGPFLPAWSTDPRGAITSRQLLWQLSGLSGGPYRPLNPFSARAQLASGPSFDRAAMDIEAVYPPGSHFEPTPANAQILARLASELSDMSFADVLESRLWGRFAAHPAKGLLDHRRGALAAHCCLHATAEDWLRLALMLSNDGLANGSQVLTPGYVAQISTAALVNPGFGLGYQIETGQEGEALLILQSAGRLLVAVPGQGRALFWAGREDGPGAALRARLLLEVFN